MLSDEQIERLMETYVQILVYPETAPLAIELKQEEADFIITVLTLAVQIVLDCSEADRAERARAVRETFRTVASIAQKQDNIGNPQSWMWQ